MDELNPCINWSEEKRTIYHNKIKALTFFQSRFCLGMIVNGADIDFAIDESEKAPPAKPE